MSRTTVNARQKMSKKKKAAIITCLALVAALLIGGVFAWTDFSQSFINRYRGSTDNDVQLHDDFEPGVNKDVYVENTGKNPLVVRVQFREFFQIGDTVLTPGTDLDSTTPIVRDGSGNIIANKSWPVHKFPAAAITGTGAYGEFDGSCTCNTHDYWEWQMTGAQKWYKKGVSAQGNYDYSPSSPLHDPNKCAETLAPSNVMTIAAWNALTETERETLACWILDTDGWCYWSQPLDPNTATNLLLDDVQLKKGVFPDDNYAYFIDVQLQASNKSEIADMKNNELGATGAGKGLIDEIAGRITGTTSNPVEPPEPPVNPDYDFLCKEDRTDENFPGRRLVGSINVGCEYVDDRDDDVIVGAYNIVDEYPLENIFPSSFDLTDLQVEIKGFTLTSENDFFAGQTFTAADLAPGSEITFTATHMKAKIAPTIFIILPFLNDSYDYPPYDGPDKALQDMRMITEVVFTLNNGQVSSPYFIVTDMDQASINWAG